jgi:hypothetical protein
MKYAMQEGSREPAGLTSQTRLPSAHLDSAHLGHIEGALGSIALVGANRSPIARRRCEPTCERFTSTVAGSMAADG